RRQDLLRASQAAAQIARNARGARRPRGGLGRERTGGTVALGGGPVRRRRNPHCGRGRRAPQMSEPARFLAAFAQALAGMALYADGHPARERAIDLAYEELRGLQQDTAQPLFTFLGDEVVFGQQPLRDMKAWDWGTRLANAGIQRLEFQEAVTRDDFEGFLEEVLARLTLSMIDSTPARQMRRSSIRFGPVGLKGETESPQAEALPTATLSFSLGEEAETLRWLQSEVRDRGTVPLVEAEAIVRSLSVAMHGGSQVMLPLLQLKEFDQY